MNLLIVDDDPQFAEFAANVAGGAGWKVAHAAGADAFRERFRSERPQAVALDLKLGQADGVELLRWLRGEGYDGPILLISGFDARVLAAAATLGGTLGLKIAGTVQKPVRAAELRRILEEMHGTSAPLTVAMLEEAMARDEVEMHLQPVFDSGTLALHKAEALARWRHPARGLLPPSLFIPLLEASPPAMDRFTMWAIRKIADNAGVLGVADPPIKVSANLSAVNLGDLTLPDRIAAILDQTRLPPSRLVLEITESAATSDPTATMDILTRLRLKGFGLSLDDFGTGYSSLVALHRLPFTEIKIDRGFVAEMDSSHEAPTIIKTVADLAQNLKLTSVAEGVETREAGRRLRELGVAQLQGYAFGAPVPMATFAERFAPMAERRERDRT
ncbi:MAG: EAL domain-containing protein [Alphaproteobacteria bacterium]|nr:EAL domain-containing protein [Alphaproteobacteria bacterium]